MEAQNYKDIKWKNCFVGLDLITYRDLKKVYKEAGLEEIVSEFHFLENQAKTRASPFIGSTVRHFFLEWTYGYGSRPLRLLWYSLAVIGLFASIYSYLSIPRELKSPGETRSGLYRVLTAGRGERTEPLRFRKGLLFLHCFYFSLLSFATFGYGALKPKQWLQLFRLEPVEYKPIRWARIFVGIEAALGIWVFALLVTVLFGK